MSNICDRTFIAVNLDNIIYNVLKVSKKIGTSKKIIAVIKCDGYGHGAIPIARELEKINCIFGYATATAEEALALRKSGIKKMILVLGHVFESQYDEIIKNNISITVYSLESGYAISAAASKLNINAKIHIKVDTGMNRIGIKPSVETISIVQDIAALPGIIMEGIFTHFPNADVTDKQDTIERLRNYQDFVKLLHVGGVDFEIHHYANSACIIDLECNECDAVRLGISLYGLYPSDEVENKNIFLRPALSMYAAIIHVKEIMKGEGVSYGQTFIAQKNMKVATIALGYGDGYPRSLSNKGYVLICGKKARILGRICMDQFMVDVSEIENVVPGDMATVIGKDESETITVDYLGDLSGRFSYEFVCDLGKRIPRVFIKDGKPFREDEMIYFY